jgi:hypothetical protein
MISNKKNIKLATKPTPSTTNQVTLSTASTSGKLLNIVASLAIRRMEFRTYDEILTTLRPEKQHPDRKYHPFLGRFRFPAKTRG